MDEIISVTIEFNKQELHTIACCMADSLSRQLSYLNEADNEDLVCRIERAYRIACLAKKMEIADFSELIPEIS